LQSSTAQLWTAFNWFSTYNKSGNPQHLLDQGMKTVYWTILVLVLAVGIYFYLQDIENNKGYSCRTLEQSDLQQEFTKYAKHFKSECVKLPKANISLHVLDNQNSQAKETIVFSHGMLVSTYMWASQLDFFSSQGYRVIAFDHRGQGLSESPEGFEIIEMEQLADDLTELLEVLQTKRNIGKVHLVGLSMGGITCIRVAAARPDLVKSLTVSNSDYLPQQSQNIGNLIFVQIIRYFGMQSWIAKSIMPSFFGSEYLSNQTTVDSWVSFFNHNIKKPIWKTILGVFGRRGVAEEISKISVPTVILHGDSDPSLPIPYAQNMASKIKGSQFVSITNASHFCATEKPQQYNEELLKFLKQLK
jgi:pimeloyl-ACP methyl ester carboxylesterase